MKRFLARRASTALGVLATAVAAMWPASDAAAFDYACNFVEVQCDRATNLVRVVPFRAENEECERVRAVKDADWLIDVARYARVTGKDRTGATKVVQCDLGGGKSVAITVRGAPMDAKLQGPCGAVFSAIVSIDEQRPHPRRVLNELNLLQHCSAGGAADSIEYFPDSQKLLIQWSSEQRFGVLERTVLARKNLQEAARARR